MSPLPRAPALYFPDGPGDRIFCNGKARIGGCCEGERCGSAHLLARQSRAKLNSNGIVATDDYLSKNADLVKRFVRASLRGWQFALRNPKKAVEDQIKFVPSLSLDNSVSEVEVVKGLAVTPEVEKNGLGWFDPAEMKSSLDFVIKNVGITGTAPTATDLYATGFLPSPPIKP